MTLNLPTVLTLLRIVIIPVLVVVFYLPYGWSNEVVVGLFIAAGITDWADGWIARRYEMMSPFGAFLDPVADKLLVAVALVLIVQKHPEILLALAAAIILGREITISALREWMAEIGQRARVRVSAVGKSKTVFQMVAIGFLLYGEPLLDLPVMTIGRVLLVIAAGLTIWSMVIYLRSAWPAITAERS
ncbi:CDP-diacylglycerol--glycerol-3-phosphate 3-phosphatidyltransferase [Wenzhouxiangella sp. XN79A]|uniref:CDP-diacylglycerol--glycerol-3-phosphate 3-phosphatidyltransferase n=1 Tax=Wenzhouxiangella sp. XN79A TaxID=2724193 RepID=UPI00144A5E39|nr:CDP-diacylglycerol--glycerol-3-phosphate 3-phosphatidyltransferase [Wenzhouxiangella sp. XN79A]NKI35477.1 CDP-diacylglycerol--glycerol-3-phosphate 3-phosphatidyltransferase [Wenzhouxiangella sp. XN79A]